MIVQQLRNACPSVGGGHGVVGIDQYVGVLVGESKEFSEHPVSDFEGTSVRA